MSVVVETDAIAGPASYATGGFTITTGRSTLNWLGLSVSVPGANLPPCRFDITLNSPGAGQARVKILREATTKLSSIGAMSGLPSGVTAQSSSGQTYDANTAHTHTMDHDHAAVTSSAPVNTGPTGVNALLGGSNYSAHTHSFDPPNYTGNLGTTTHTHTNNNIYQHQHTATLTQTDIAGDELANGTNLSGATFNYLAVE